MSAKTRTLALLVLLVTVSLVSAWFYCIEAYPHTEDLGWQQQVRINPFYSAEKYLEASGSEVTTVQKLEGLENFTTGTTLLISNASEVVTEQQAETLYRWMEAGGTIIITAPESPEKDPLLRNFDLSWLNLPVEEGDDEEPAQLLTELHFSGIEAPLTADFDVYNGLSHPYMYDTEAQIQHQPLYWAGNDYGAQFIQFKVGDGLLCVITDHGIFQTAGLQEHDHAFLLSILVGESPLVILHNNAMPHLLQLIWRAAPAFCISLFVMLSMWLLLKASRFGPRYQFQERQRRALNDHLKSEPQYLWQLGQFDQVCKQLLEDLKLLLVKRGNNLQQMNDDEIFLLLNKLSGTDMAKLFDELSHGKTLGEKRFVDNINILQALRKQL